MRLLLKSPAVHALSLSFISGPLLLCTGCATQARLTKCLNEVAAEDRARNQEIAMAMGQREFDADKEAVLKSLIRAFSNKNMAILNIDKEMGYILAEGSNILPPAKHEELGNRNVARLNKRVGWPVWKYAGTNTTKRVTVNVTPLGPQRTRVNVGLSSTVQGNQQIKSHELPHFFTTAIYEELWRAIDKAIFIHRETDG